LEQFLWESVILTFVGGMAGIVLGAGIVAMLSLVLPRFLATGWAFTLPPSAIGLAVLVSTVTGLIFGIYPARQAAKKNPIDALRYE
jgi:ABC-type antimicrobial peptide transport system permease subunit